MHNPFYHRDFKKVRSVHNRLQDLALLCQRPEPQGYVSAAITFMKWEESGRSDTFFMPEDLTEVGQDDMGEEQEEAGHEAEVTRNDAEEKRKLQWMMKTMKKKVKKKKTVRRSQEQPQRGSECSDYEQWTRDHLLLPDSDEEPLDYNPAPGSMALRIISPRPRDSAGRLIQTSGNEAGDGSQEWLMKNHVD